MINYSTSKDFFVEEKIAQAIIYDWDTF